MGRVRRRGDEAGAFIYTDPRRSVQEERIVEREYDELGRVRRERLGVRTRMVFHAPHQLGSGEPEGWLRRIWGYLRDFILITFFFIVFLVVLAIGYELGELRGLGIVLLCTALVVAILANTG